MSAALKQDKPPPATLLAKPHIPQTATTIIITTTTAAALGGGYASYHDEVDAVSTSSADGVAPSVEEEGDGELVGEGLRPLGDGANFRHDDGGADEGVEEAIDEDPTDLGEVDDAGLLTNEGIYGVEGGSDAAANASSIGTTSGGKRAEEALFFTTESTTISNPATSTYTRPPPGGTRITTTTPTAITSSVGEPQESNWMPAGDPTTTAPAMHSSSSSTTGGEGGGAESGSYTYTYPHDSSLIIIPLTTADSTTSSSSTFSTEEVVGIAVGVSFAGLVLVGLIGYACWRWLKGSAAGGGGGSVVAGARKGKKKGGGVKIAADVITFGGVQAASSSSLPEITSSALGGSTLGVGHNGGRQEQQLYIPLRDLGENGGEGEEEERREWVGLAFGGGLGVEEGGVGVGARPRPLDSLPVAVGWEMVVSSGGGGRSNLGRGNSNTVGGIGDGNTRLAAHRTHSAMSLDTNDEEDTYIRPAGATMRGSTNVAGAEIAGIGKQQQALRPHASSSSAAVADSFSDIGDDDTFVDDDARHRTTIGRDVGNDRPFAVEMKPLGGAVTSPPAVQQTMGMRIQQGHQGDVACS